MTSLRAPRIEKWYTYRLVELDLAICVVAKHLLHLCLLSALENLLLAKGLVTERIRRLMSSRDSILQLRQTSSVIGNCTLPTTYLLDLCIQLAHALNTAAVVVRTSE